MLIRYFLLMCLLFLITLNGNGQHNYEIQAYAEQKINLIAFDHSGISKGISGSAYKRFGFGFNFLTFKSRKFKIGIAGSYNENYNRYGGSGTFFYGLLNSWRYKNCKLSGIISSEIKHRFYFSAYVDICYFTYQYLNGDLRDAPKGSPYSYESSNPNIFALALSVRFGKKFKIFKNNFLGVHVGLQSPYLYFNWEPVYFKGVNLAGMVLGLNYTVGWGGKKDDAKK